MNPEVAAAIAGQRTVAQTEDAAKKLKEKEAAASSIPGGRGIGGETGGTDDSIRGILERQLSGEGAQRI